MTYLRLTKICFEAFVSVIRTILILIRKMYMNDVKFSWWSFSKFVIDLKSLIKVKMCILTKVIWMIRFSNFLTLSCNSLIFCFWLKLLLKIKRFSSQCSLKKKCQRCSRNRCRSTFLCIYLKGTNFLRLYIATWYAWIASVLRSSVTDFCKKHSCRHNDDFFKTLLILINFFNLIN